MKFSLVLANRPGVLGRIALVFSRRGLNIESLSVQHTLDRRLSQMWIQCAGDASRATEVSKQLLKIIDVIHVVLQEHRSSAETLTKVVLQVECQKANKAAVLQCLQYSDFVLTDFDEQSVRAQKTEITAADEALLMILRHYGKVELRPVPNGDSIGSVLGSAQKLGGDHLG